MMMPVRMMLLAIAGWLNEEQRQRIEFLQKQIRILQELHGGGRIRFNDDQRRRLAAKGKHLRWVIGQYMEHDHLERPHQGGGNQPLTKLPESGSGAVDGRIPLVKLQRAAGEGAKEAAEQAAGAKQQKV